MKRSYDVNPGTEIASSCPAGGNNMSSRWKSLLALVAVTFFVGSPIVHADGPGSGNGGSGVLLDGKPYLLDLVEGGVEKDPYFNPKVSAAPEILQAVQKIFVNNPQFPVELIARKITEISQIQYVYALLMLKTMEVFQWKLVNLPPEPVNDFRPGVALPNGSRLQLAKRLEKSIIIDKSAALQMTPENLTALIFHETAYAFAKPVKGVQGFMAQDVGAVQEFTAFLFTPPTGAQLNNFIVMIENIYPANFYQLGYGGIVKNVSDRIGQIQVNPVVNFKLGNNKLEMKPKKILSLDGLRLFEDRNGGDESFSVQYAQQEICRQLPVDKKALSFEVIEPYKYFEIAFYEVSTGQFDSYVRVTGHNGNDIAFAVDIDKDSCSKVVAAQVQAAMARALPGYHRNY